MKYIAPLSSAMSAAVLLSGASSSSALLSSPKPAQQSSSSHRKFGLSPSPSPSSSPTQRRGRQPSFFRARGQEGMSEVDKLAARRKRLTQRTTNRGGRSSSPTSSSPTSSPPSDSMSSPSNDRKRSYERHEEASGSVSSVAGLEYLHCPNEWRDPDELFHILLLGSTFEGKRGSSMSNDYVAVSCSNILGMSHGEAHELINFAKYEGMSRLGTWTREECLKFGEELQSQELKCRVVPFVTGGIRANVVGGLLDEPLGGGDGWDEDAALGDEKGDLVFN